MIKLKTLFQGFVFYTKSFILVIKIIFHWILMGLIFHGPAFEQ